MLQWLRNTYIHINITLLKQKKNRKLTTCHTKWTPRNNGWHYHRATFCFDATKSDTHVFSGKTSVLRPSWDAGHTVTTEQEVARATFCSGCTCVPPTHPPSPAQWLCKKSLKGNNGSHDYNTAHWKLNFKSFISNSWKYRTHITWQMLSSCRKNDVNALLFSSHNIVLPHPSQKKHEIRIYK